MSNATMDSQSKTSGQAASRKGSLEHTIGVDGYGSKPPVSPPDNYEGDYLTTRSMHPVPNTMSDFMMNDCPPMIGMHYDPYCMPPPYMPMHPADSMGPMLDQMMDYGSYPAPPRFMPPRRPPQGAPRLPPPRGNMRTPPRLPEKMLQPRPATNMRPPSLPPPMMPMADLADLNQSTPKRRGRAPSGASFPTKLYKILEDPRYQAYITWLPHGRAWRVLKPKAFEEEVIPKFFRSDRYASFMRQVNGWGFKRITEGPDLNSYYHEMFLRGLPEVCARMRRPQKGQNNATKDGSQCPDFYKISKSAPLPALKRSPYSGEPPSKLQALPKEMGSPGVVSTDGDSNGGVGSIPGSPNKNNRQLKAPPGNQGAPLTSSPGTARGSMDGDFMGPSASSPGSTPNSGQFLSSASASPLDYARQGGRGLSPEAFVGSRDFVDLPTSSGNSVSSWTNEHPDSEFMWMATSFNQPPPGAFGQVTPPSARPVKNRSGDLMAHSSSSSSSSLMDMDSNGLSAADLFYLTRQNRILLSQTGGNEPSREGAGKK